MKSVKPDEFKNRVVETLKSIANDADAGKLGVGEDFHPFFRVSEPVHELLGMETDDLASLLVARLTAQGFILFFSEEQARRVMAEGLINLEDQIRKAQGD